MAGPSALPHEKVAQSRSKRHTTICFVLMHALRSNMLNSGRICLGLFDLLGVPASPALCTITDGRQPSMKADATSLSNKVPTTRRMPSKKTWKKKESHPRSNLPERWETGEVDLDGIGVILHGQYHMLLQRPVVPGQPPMASDLGRWLRRARGGCARWPTPHLPGDAPGHSTQTDTSTPRRPGSPGSSPRHSGQACRCQ